MVELSTSIGNDNFFPVEVLPQNIIQSIRAGINIEVEREKLGQGKIGEDTSVALSCSKAVWQLSSHLNGVFFR